MTRFPKLWALLTGKAAPNPRIEAKAAYDAADRRGDTRGKGAALRLLQAATRAELEAGR